MEIKHLQYFLEVSKTENFTHAAENLYITQPALSRTIKSLEEELDTPLFIRTRKKLILTEAGHILHNYAQTIEKQFKYLEQDINHLLKSQEDHIWIGLPTIVNSSFFSQLLASFHEKYQEVTYHLEEDGSKRVEEKILDGKLDFGVVALSEHTDRFNYKTFINERLNLVVPSSHHLADNQEISLQDLNNEPFIMFNQDFMLRNNIIKSCNASGFQPKIISETSQLDFVEEMIASNLGITLLPKSISMELTSHVQTIPVVNPTIEWNLSLIWKRDTNFTHVKKDFMYFAKERLEQLVINSDGQ